MIYQIFKQNELRDKSIQKPKVINKNGIVKSFWFKFSKAAKVNAPSTPNNFLTRFFCTALVLPYKYHVKPENRVTFYWQISSPLLIFTQKKALY